MTWNDMDVKEPHFSSSFEMSIFSVWCQPLTDVLKKQGVRENRTGAVFSVYEKGVDVVNGEWTVFR